MAVRRGLSRGAISRLRLALAIAAVAALLVIVVVLAPPWFIDDDSLDGLEAQNQVRTTLLQGVAGLVLLVGAYFTWRQLHTAREGQITERYTRAIDQLGHTQLDVRLGGIYALERIARDSPADRVTIGEVLTAFVRTHARWPPSQPGQYRATAPIHQVPQLQVRAPDVQATVTVLGRRGFSAPEREGPPLDLSQVDLRWADVMEAHLEGAVLFGAHLEEANLRGAHLEGAALFGAHLERAILEGAHLEEADLFGAQLEEASLIDAHLEGAHLHAAYLEGAILIGAHLEGAEADESTIWPAGFDWRAAGVIRPST